MSAKDEMMKIISEQKVKVLEDVIDYAQRLIAMEQRFMASKERGDNGPYWHCPACQLTCYGWKGDKHLCPHCGEKTLTAISEEVYRDNS